MIIWMCLKWWHWQEKSNIFIWTHVALGTWWGFTIWQILFSAAGEYWGLCGGETGILYWDGNSYSWLAEVLHVPGLLYTLISEPQLDREGYEINAIQWRQTTFLKGHIWGPTVYSYFFNLRDGTYQLDIPQDSCVFANEQLLMQKCRIRQICGTFAWAMFAMMTWRGYVTQCCRYFFPEHSHAFILWCVCFL